MKSFWANEGIRFSCTQCSHCCRHESGYVFLTENDIRRLHEHLEVSRDQFISKYCVRIPFGDGFHISLSEKQNYDCIFWVDGGCSVYAARPVQCRTYPFWSPFLESRERWEQEARECPGIGIGPAFDVNEIEALLEERSRRLPVIERGESREM